MSFVFTLFLLFLFLREGKERKENKTGSSFLSSLSLLCSPSVSVGKSKDRGSLTSRTFAKGGRDAVRERRKVLLLPVREREGTATGGKG